MVPAVIQSGLMKGILRLQKNWILKRKKRNQKGSRMKIYRKTYMMKFQMHLL